MHNKRKFIVQQILRTYSLIHLEQMLIEMCFRCKCQISAIGNGNRGAFWGKEKL